MRKLSRFRLTVVAILALAGMTASAFADTVYNTIDNTVDATHEQMNLTFPGSNGSTTLQLQVDGRPDHPGCNINGAHYLGLAASTSPAGIVDISWGGGDAIFDECTDVLTVIVTPLAVGATTVTFTEDEANTSKDPHMTFNFGQATFDVNVTAGSSGNACDADPAAPAWAAAILQKNGYKPKSSNFSNYVSKVANHMGNGATFEGYAKNVHPEYENAVHDWMQSSFGISLPYSAAQSARPGWVCTSIA
jgi:hypothetical protein